MLYSSLNLSCLPSICVVDLNRLVFRSSSEQFLGRMEGDGEDGLSVVGQGFDDAPGVGVVDVDLLIKRSSGE